MAAFEFLQRVVWPRGKVKQFIVVPNGHTQSSGEKQSVIEKAAVVESK